MGVGSILERDIRIDFPLLFHANEDILHLEFESHGGYSPSIPGLARLAEYTQNMA